jgi:hypothetical protein
MSERYKFADLETAWNTIASIIDVMEEYYKANDRSGLKGTVAYLADATAAFVRFLRMRNPHCISLGATTDREYWKDMGPQDILGIVSYESKIAHTIINAKQVLLKDVRSASQKRLSAEINKMIHEAKRRVKEAKEYIEKYWPGHWQPDEFISRWL